MLLSKSFVFSGISVIKHAINLYNCFASLALDSFIRLGLQHQWIEEVAARIPLLIQRSEDATLSGGFISF